MEQTENTAIVLRYANYRDNDRMLTLFSPTKGKVDVLSRGCRRPRSPLLNGSELFALGNFELYEKGGRYTLTSVSLIETFYPMRLDYQKLSIGSYMAEIVENVIQPGECDQDLFLLLIHSLSRLTFSSQEWKPLLAGFLLNFSAIEGFKPRLNHCSVCGKKMADDKPGAFSTQAGGVVCLECRRPGMMMLESQQLGWMRRALMSPASKWVNSDGETAPLPVIMGFVQEKLGIRLHCQDSLPL